MYHILIISHGGIAEAYRETIRMISGETDGIGAVGIMGGESKQDFALRLEREVKRLLTPDGLLIAADLFGGTPCNLVIAEILARYSGIRAVSGVNLPMVLEALTHQRGSLSQAVEAVMEAGHGGIRDINLEAASLIVNSEDV